MASRTIPSTALRQWVTLWRPSPLLLSASCRKKGRGRWGLEPFWPLRSVREASDLSTFLYFLTYTTCHYHARVRGGRPARDEGPVDGGLDVQDAHLRHLGPPSPGGWHDALSSVADRRRERRRHLVQHHAGGQRVLRLDDSATARTDVRALAQDQEYSLGWAHVLPRQQDAAHPKPCPRGRVGTHIVWQCMSGNGRRQGK
eukprot:5466424-Prymnesium_polylepis.1